jgi:hypothetical protein
MTPTLKPGIKTSEFYLTILSSLLSLALCVLDLLDARWAVSAIAILNLFYTSIRSKLKEPQGK